MREGAGQRTVIAQRTGLSIDVVDAAMEHLTRIGVLSAQSLSSGCPSGGCSGCPAPTGHGCSAPVGGAVMLTLATSAHV
jgi:hypothetical protein